MEIVQNITENLEDQLEQYQRLLNLAERKSHLISKKASDREVEDLHKLVKSEVQVVSVLKELENKRKGITKDQDFDSILQDSDVSRDRLVQLKDAIKDVAHKLHRVNSKNSLALNVSLKVINKMIQSVKDLSIGKEVTYSRVKKNKRPQAYRSLNLTV